MLYKGVYLAGTLEIVDGPWSGESCSPQIGRNKGEGRTRTTSRRKRVGTSVYSYPIVHPTSKLAFPDQYQSTKNGPHESVSGRHGIFKAAQIRESLLCGVLTLVSVVAIGRATQINCMTANNDQAISSDWSISRSRRHDERRNKDVVWRLPESVTV